VHKDPKNKIGELALSYRIATQHHFTEGPLRYGDPSIGSKLRPENQSTFGLMNALYSGLIAAFP
jgi:hypothetical protein